MKQIKLGSLFDGVAGFPLAGVRNGITPKWASEIEPYPIAVTKNHFPGMKHVGSVTEIKGSELEPVDIITFGSPCQDLSVAGKQAGIHEGARSSLFFQAIRIIKEMREKDIADGRTDQFIRPRFAVWENVPGAYSSNGGKDFRAVIQAFCDIRGGARPYCTSRSGRTLETCWVHRGKRLERCLAHIGRSILGSAPAQEKNLSCGRFCRRTRRRDTI